MRNWHFEFAKFYYIIELWQRFIKRNAIIAGNIMKDMENIIVRIVAGCRLMGLSIKSLLLNQGGKVEFIRNAVTVGKNFMLILIERILESSVHRLVRIGLMLKSFLRQGWEGAILGMGKDLGIILMAKDVIIMQGVNGEDLLKKSGMGISVKFAE